MRLAVSTWSLSYMSLDEAIRTIKRLGVDVVEILLDEPHLRPADMSSKMLLRVKELVNSTGLEVIIHAPFLNLNIASADETKRSYSSNLYKRALEVAYTLEAELITFHPGYPDFPGIYEQSLLLSINTMTKILDMASQLGVNVAIENMIDTKREILCVTAEDTLMYLNSLGDRVLLTLDLGHAHIARELYNFIRKLSDVIVNVHIHDNDGAYDQHLPLGMGTLNYSAALSSLLKHAKGLRYLTIETTPRIGEEGVVMTIKRLEELIY
ncbi:MAG: hypothetical protein DRN15_03985 [Thermoprotei archaeon]|nr:MAG: hypothetical protein DRM97_06075 [Thermoprotei archaeon]RLF24063.1 MAG: hypothetical protein DRN15_03985 [Thermoprotei archaeon]